MPTYKSFADAARALRAAEAAEHADDVRRAQLLAEHADSIRLDMAARGIPGPPRIAREEGAR